MSIAKIEGGIVVQVDRTSDDAPEGWERVGDHVTCGMVRAGDDFAAPASPPPSTLDKIRAIEARVTPRRLREAITTDAGKAWLANIEAEIATERAKL